MMLKLLMRCPHVFTTLPADHCQREGQIYTLNITIHRVLLYSILNLEN